MWITEQTARIGSPAETGAGIGPVTIGGGNTAVLLEGEARNLSLLCPGGIRWQPGATEQVLVLETGDGERVVLGSVVQPGALEDGTLCLSSGSSRLVLDQDGVHIFGPLFLNGTALHTGEEA